jgi:hypothetical protein
MHPIQLLVNDGWEVIGSEEILEKDSAPHYVYFLEKDEQEIKVVVY